MKSEIKREPSEEVGITKAKFRMAFLLLLFYLITLAGGYFAFPFLGFTSSIQNDIYGIIVGSPFWVIVVISLIKIGKRVSH